MPSCSPAEAVLDLKRQDQTDVNHEPTQITLKITIYWQFCHATISIPPNLYKNLNLTIMRIMVWLKHSLKIKLALRLSNFSMFKCNIYKQGWAIWPQKINNFSYQSISVIITINDDSLFLSSSKSLQSKSCWNQLIVVVNYFVRMTKTCQTGEYFTNLTKNIQNIYNEVFFSTSKYTS